MDVEPEATYATSKDAMMAYLHMPKAHATWDFGAPNLMKKTQLRQNTAMNAIKKGSDLSGR